MQRPSRHQGALKPSWARLVAYNTASRLTAAMGNDRKQHSGASVDTTKLNIVCCCCLDTRQMADEREIKHSPKERREAKEKLTQSTKTTEGHRTPVNMSPRTLVPSCSLTKTTVLRFSHNRIFENTPKKKQRRRVSQGPDDRPGVTGTTCQHCA